MPSRQISSEVSAKAQTNKKLISLFMLFALLALGSLLVAAQVHAAENLYTKNYVEQNDGHLKSFQAHPETEMYVSNHKDDDNISMLEKGYDMMGSSGFDATDTPAAMALEHAKNIKADIVLVYSKYGSEKTASSKIELIKEAAKNGGEIDAKDLEAEATHYQYYASYWAKLPTPLLGVHVIKLIPAKPVGDDIPAPEVKGLTIIAVINDSPAAKASIVKGDQILKIGDVTMNKPDDLFAAVKRYAGQTIPVELQRGTEEVKTTVALNSRH